GGPQLRQLHPESPLRAAAERYRYRHFQPRPGGTDEARARHLPLRLAGGLGVRHVDAMATRLADRCAAAAGPAGRDRPRRLDRYADGAQPLAGALAAPEEAARLCPGDAGGTGALL